MASDDADAYDWYRVFSSTMLRLLVAGAIRWPPWPWWRSVWGAKLLSANNALYDSRRVTADYLTWSGLASE